MAGQHSDARSAFFRELEARLADALAGDEGVRGPKPQLILEAARAACLHRNAKRLRPELAWLCGQLLNAPGDQVLAVAVASELLHTASLLHDDIIDGATERRSQPTASARWGGTLAVLAGDLALSLGFLELKGAPQAILIAATSTFAVMTQGAIAELQARGRLDLSLERWRQIAEGKTGALFAFCGLSAAHLVDDPEAVMRLQAFGSRVGVAFQMADDLIDLVGHGKGRDPFADLRNREVAFPTLLAARTSAELARSIERLWSTAEQRDRDVQVVGQALLSSGAAESTIGQIREEIEEAIAVLGDLYERPGGDRLGAWARSIPERTEQCLGVKHVPWWIAAPRATTGNAGHVSQRP